MREIAFGVELVTSVDTTVNLAGANTFDNCWNSVEKIILHLLAFDTSVEPMIYFAQPLSKGSLRLE